MGNLTFNEWCRVYDTGDRQPNWHGGAIALAAIALFCILVFVWEFLC